MPLRIIRDDITRVKADAIVNAANSQLRAGGGVCGAIFAAAGEAELSQACRAIGYCPTGQAVITPGFQLPAKFVIHAVGPVWQGGQHGERELLASCYQAALELALAHRLRSIAFPLISTGIYGYPKAEALQVAIRVIGAFLLEHDMTVTLVVYDGASFAISEKLFSSIAAYIDDRYLDEHPDYRRSRQMMSFELSESMAEPIDMMMSQVKASRSLDDLVKHPDETFSQMLLRLIDEKGLTDAVVYKRANIDRRHFSKIRGDSQYQAKKATALALAIALELNLDETRDLLARAGYALSRSSKMDIIIEYFLTEGNHNIFEINEALFAFDQPLLGA